MYSHTDTRVERNALMSRVYPKLRDFCHEQGYEFQVVDMRWGVRDPCTDDHKISEISLKELHTCQELSTGPNFVVSRLWKRLSFCRTHPSPKLEMHRRVPGVFKRGEGQILLLAYTRQV